MKILRSFNFHPAISIALIGIAIVCATFLLHLSAHPVYSDSSWNQIPASETLNGYLSGVSAGSVSDVWAVGYVLSDSGYNPAAYHWNGSTWGTNTVEGNLESS